MCCRLFIVFFCSILCVVSVIQADVPLPPNTLDPKTPAEAWNAIRLSTANVAKLLLEKRISEVSEQISICSPALRLLARIPAVETQRSLINEQTSRAFSLVNTIAQCCMVRSQADADKAFLEFQSVILKLESAFDAADVKAEIYYCATHPEIISTAAGAACRKCATPLRLRRIPYSFVYVMPGTPTLKLSLIADAPLLAGQETQVQMQLRTISGLPVTESDLLVVHTKPIHLLITDASLGSFQTVHPVPAAQAGDYTFTFTPCVDGPCRIWADVVPLVTGLQELPYADIGGLYLPGAPKETPDVFSTTNAGYTFELSFAGGLSGQINAKQIQLMRIQVTDSSGKLVDRLEPIMSAFAQVVGFYDDHQSVLRLHPMGSDILRDDLRGGPHLGFKIYAPRPGFLRFYCQIRIDGRTLTVPFSVNVDR